MSHDTALALLAVLVWGSLAAVVAVILWFARRADAGWGAGRERRRPPPLPPRTGGPVAFPPRHVSPARGRG